MRADLKNTPRKPCLLRSIKAGAVARTYVHVQMMSKTTRSNEWKLNSADCRAGPEQEPD